MSKKMLVDASHPEETRVVVVSGSRVEEFDYENADRLQLKGNIYLAKVTRVEPSLQACFVEYGGNRHGFLPFSEIHPDYYQIPVDDRRALLEASRAEARYAADEDERPQGQRNRGRNNRGRGRGRPQHSADGQGGNGQPAASPDEMSTAVDAEGNAFQAAPSSDFSGQEWGQNDERDDQSPAYSPPYNDNAGQGPFEADAHHHDHHDHGQALDDVHDRGADDKFGASQSRQSDDEIHAPTTGEQWNEQGAPDFARESYDNAPYQEQHENTGSLEKTRFDDSAGLDDQPDLETDDQSLPSSIETVETAMPAEDIETMGAEDALDELPQRDPRYMRRYKIQEVIKRRQILLIQVVKEERGNKGAAVTTFLSLAGRYCVLMPNTDRGGGISRKIANPADRRKLKELATELDVPEGMGLIIRTAGANRTKQEIRRDFEYLLREWEAVRDLTLKSSAPTLVYEEGSLIKRAIRDLYNKDIDEIQVEGSNGAEEAREFMRLLMPSHASMVQTYRERVPLFQAYGVEAQLDSMFSPTVRLRSGGYIVINQTEALVAIDVNSGKATREHNIEDTALKTNLEAAEEVARQLRLRDLAGLIVIDFIDMEEGRNNRHVEKRLKDSLKSDRARIQVGRISPFGLLEMSRQRLRSGMVEGSTVPCPHCEGRGIIRSVGSMALRILRAVEEYCQRQSNAAITLRVPPEIATYIVNYKRAQLADMEARYHCYVYIEAKGSLTASSYEIERGAPYVPEPRKARRTATAVSLDTVLDGATEPVDDTDLDTENDDAAPADTPDSEVPAAASEESAEDRGGRRRRRRRGRGRDHDGPQERPAASNPEQRQTARVTDATFQEPRRPLPGIPSPADFSFGPHDLPDTSPDAFDEPVAVRQLASDNVHDGAEDDGTEDDDNDAVAGAQEVPGAGSDEQGQRRRRRRGRRGRRNRGDDTRDSDDRAPRQDGDRGPRPAPRPGPFGSAASASDPRNDVPSWHLGRKHSEPQFEWSAIDTTPLPPTPAPTHSRVSEPVQPRRSHTAAPEVSNRDARSGPAPAEEPDRAQLQPVAEPAAQRTPPAEAKSDWNLASLFGFGPKPQTPPAAATEAQPTPAGPPKKGWWQRKSDSDGAG